jgi:hypothetical protein
MVSTIAKTIVGNHKSTNGGDSTSLAAPRFSDPKKSLPLPRPEQVGDDVSGSSSSSSSSRGKDEEEEDQDNDAMEVDELPAGPMEEMVDEEEVLEESHPPAEVIEPVSHFIPIATERVWYRHDVCDRLATVALDRLSARFRGAITGGGAGNGHGHAERDESDPTRRRDRPLALSHSVMMIQASLLRGFDTSWKARIETPRLQALAHYERSKNGTDYGSIPVAVRDSMEFKYWPIESGAKMTDGQRMLGAHLNNFFMTPLLPTATTNPSVSSSPVALLATLQQMTRYSLYVDPPTSIRLGLGEKLPMSLLDLVSRVPLQAQEPFATLRWLIYLTTASAYAFVQSVVSLAKGATVSLEPRAATVDMVRSTTAAVMSTTKNPLKRTAPTTDDTPHEKEEQEKLPPPAKKPRRKSGEKAEKKPIAAKPKATNPKATEEAAPIPRLLASERPPLLPSPSPSSSNPAKLSTGQPPPRSLVMTPVCAVLLPLSKEKHNPRDAQFDQAGQLLFLASPAFQASVVAASSLLSHNVLQLVARGRDDVLNLKRDATGLVEALDAARQTPLSRLKHKRTFCDKFQVVVGGDAQGSVFRKSTALSAVAQYLRLFVQTKDEVAAAEPDLRANSDKMEIDGEAIEEAEEDDEDDGLEDWQRFAKQNQKMAKAATATKAATVAAAVPEELNRTPPILQHLHSSLVVTEAFLERVAALLFIIEPLGKAHEAWFSGYRSSREPILWQRSVPPPAEQPASLRLSFGGDSAPLLRPPPVEAASVTVERVTEFFTIAIENIETIQEERITTPYDCWFMFAVVLRALFGVPLKEQPLLVDLSAYGMASKEIGEEEGDFA